MENESYGIAEERKEPTPVYVKLYEGNLLVFSPFSSPEEEYGQYVDYGDIQNEVYSETHMPPWLSSRLDYGTGKTEIYSNVTRVIIEKGLVPKNMAYWFAYLSKVKTFNLVNIDINRVESVERLFLNCSQTDLIYIRHPSWGEIEMKLGKDTMFEGCKINNLTQFSAKEVYTKN